MPLLYFAQNRETSRAAEVFAPEVKDTSAGAVKCYVLGAVAADRRRAWRFRHEHESTRPTTDGSLDAEER